MQEIIDGKIYTDGKTSRKVLSVNKGWVSYLTSNGLYRIGWISTFQEWAKAEINKE